MSNCPAQTIFEMLQLDLETNTNENMFKYCETYQGTKRLQLIKTGIDTTELRKILPAPERYVLRRPKEADLHKALFDTSNKIRVHYREMYNRAIGPEAHL